MKNVENDYEPKIYEQPIYSQMDYPKFRPVTKPSYKQQTSHRKNFAEHNYNYVYGAKIKKNLKEKLKISFHKIKIYRKQLQIQ